MTSSRLLARNSVLNLVGQVLPIVVAVLAIPPLVRGLGAERFGVLTLAWAAIGYFGLFELGLGRALTQSVAQRLGNGDREDLASITWTALVLLFALGVLGAIVLAALTPLLVGRLLNVPSELVGETQAAFWILAASLPLVVTSVGLRGVMEAHQHFGVATALRVPLAVLTFLGPLAVLPFSTSLVPAIWVLVLGRALGFAAHLGFCLRMYAFMRKGIALRAAAVASLLRFGAWMTVSNVISPLMVSLDRFLVGALLPLAAVAHYVTPYEVVTKLLIIPIGVMAAIFPAFASTVTTDRARMAQLYDRSMRAVMLLLFPMVLVAVALAKEGLFLWVGPVLPNESAQVLKWLAVGVFINGIAQPPLVALQSAARPDIVAKLHVFELPLYALAILFLVRAFGLPGVAIAWTLRVAIDAVALLAIARQELGLAAMPRHGGPWSVLAMLAAIGGASVPAGTQGRVIYVVVAGIVFVPFAWFALLTAVERRALFVWMRRPAQPVAPTEGVV